MIPRRALLATLALAGCASVDQISFDRGAFAITFTKLMTVGLGLIEGAITKGTKAGVLSAHGQELTKFKDKLLEVQAEVEKQIMAAPQRAGEINTQGLQTVVDVLAKAVPLILPFLVGA